uniref:Uncharacterized protein n=1 Tax=Oxytricha trifallax TaxID=1172189 RepID=G9HRJ1_9SPIT|nr:hypothetical protein [Oxytricha trifallax]
MIQPILIKVPCMSSILILTKNISLQTKFKSFNFMLYFWKRNLKNFFLKIL